MAEWDDPSARSLAGTRAPSARFPPLRTNPLLAFLRLHPILKMHVTG